MCPWNDTGSVTGRLQQTSSTVGDKFTAYLANDCMPVSLTASRQQLKSADMQNKNKALSARVFADSLQLS